MPGVPPVSGCYRIFANLPLTASARRVLEEGTAGHELLLPGADAAADDRVRGAHIFFGQPDPAVIERARDVRWIQISSSGITRYDTAAFRARMSERRIAVCNSARVFAESCAQHVLSFMLSQSRSLPAGLGSRHANTEPAWHALRGSCVPLGGQTVLILGYGAIGERLAEMLAPFGMKVMAYRRRVRGDEKVPVVTGEGLSAALARAEHVVNILPESGETRNFFDEGRFREMRAGAVFYNIGRGATVDQEALVGRWIRGGSRRRGWM